MRKVLKFTAKWCSLCNHFENNLKNVATDVAFENYDYDDDTKVFGKHKINMIPAMIMFEEDKEIKRIIPTARTTVEELNQWLNNRDS